MVHWFVKLNTHTLQVHYYLYTFTPVCIPWRILKRCYSRRSPEESIPLFNTRKLRISERGSERTGEVPQYHNEHFTFLKVRIEHGLQNVKYNVDLRASTIKWLVMNFVYFCLHW